MHEITRVRRDTRRRRLEVASAEPLGDTMRRVWFTGEDLADFESAAPDDHVKLFFDDPASERGVAARDYTPRLFDPTARTLAIDFAMHGSVEEAGPATRWAMTARPRDRLEIGGPRGSTVVADDFDWYLLVGDATALPAIARRLEELRREATVHLMLVVPDGVALPPMIQRERTTSQRMRAHDLDDLIGSWPIPEGNGFVWIAAEAELARAARDAALARGLPRELMKASGYWQDGHAGAHSKLDR